MKKKFLFLFATTFTWLITSSQTNSLSANSLPEFPQVGKLMPYFELNEIQNFTRKKTSLNDFKGKWLVLDWWTQYCASCVENFPKVDMLQKEFGDKVQFILIGYTGTRPWDVSGNKAVREIYKRACLRLNFTVPFAFDSTLFQKYHLGTTPYTVVIDPNGVVQGITDFLDPRDIKNFIEGKHPDLRKAYRHDENKETNEDNTFIDSSFIFRSELAKWKINTPSGFRWEPEKGIFQALGLNVEQLFLFSFFGQDSFGPNDSLYGKVYSRPILQIKDSSIFENSGHSDVGHYSYSVLLPNQNLAKGLVMEQMQRDLETYFGLDATIENRKMPYWRLVLKDEQFKNKLVSKGSKTELINYSAGGFTAKSFPIKQLIGKLWYYFQLSHPFINETGIYGNIDISINALLTDFIDFKRALNENGLDLVKGEKEMKVLVIKAKN